MKKTTAEWKNELSRKTKAPRWMIESIWSDAEIDMALDIEEEYADTIEVFRRDVKVWIEYLEKIEKALPTITLDKD